MELWQICFTLTEDPEAFAEIVSAATDAETMSIHQDDLDQPWQVAIITTAEPDAAHVNAALATAASITGHSAPAMVIELLPAKDWLSENRKSFPPLDIASFWIYGSHITDPVPDGKIGLKINAGQAFGSGTHATTFGCVTMLEKQHFDKDQLIIADIGCGSGILAMAAAKRYPASRIIAVDNDILAVETSAENCRHNAVDGQVICGLSEGYDAALVQDHAPYDMILANILPQPLIAMAGDAAAALSEDGLLILSGLMEQHRDEVIAAHQALGLSLKDQMTHNGWVTLVMTKSGITTA